MKTARLLPLIFVILLLLFSCASPPKKPALSDAQLLKQAEEALEDREYEQAETLLKRFLSEYPASEWAPRAQLDLGKTYFQDKKYVEAKAEYQKFLDLHPKHQLADEAHFYLGLTHFAEIDTVDRDQAPTQRALTEFQTMLQEAPDSRYAKEAREKIRICQEKLAGHEFFIGHFYFRKGRYQAAVGRFKYLQSHYPGTPVDERTLYYLGESLYRLQEPAEAARVLVLLLERYPNTEYKLEVRSRLVAIEGF
jgi:outer membrane protein assembly factor BamD